MPDSRRLYLDQAVRALALALEAIPLAGAEDALAQPDGLGRDLDQLVLGDPFQRLLQAHLPRRSEDDVVVARRRANVGELAAARHVHVQVAWVRMLADDYAFVHRGYRPVEERAALLQIEERVRHRLAFAIGDDRAARALGDLPLPRLIPIELRGHDPFAARDGEELVAEADQAARRHAEGEPDPVRAELVHLDHAALAGTEPLGDHPDRALRDVAHHELH